MLVEISISRRGVLKLIIFGMFALWVVSIGGLISTANMARKGELSPSHPTFNAANDNAARAMVINGYTQPFPSADGKPYPDMKQLAYATGIHFSYEFWTMAFQFFTIIFAYLATTRPFFDKKFTLMSTLTIAIFQYTFFASIFIKLAYSFNGGEHHDDKCAVATKVAAAGAIGVLVMDFIFMYMYGSEKGLADDVEEADAIQAAKDNNPLAAAKHTAQETKTTVEEGTAAAPK